MKILTIFLLLFCTKCFANSFYKIYENPKYDNFRGVAFNNLILAIATNDSVVFGIFGNNSTFTEIGSKQLTHFVIGDGELMEFKFLQKHIVIACNNFDCCYCKVYDTENENKCMILKNVRNDKIHYYESINAHQENDILYIRYILVPKSLAYFETYQYVNDRYHQITRMSDRLTLKGFFESFYSFSRGNNIYFVTEFENTNLSPCLFPNKFETNLHEPHILLTQLCNTDVTIGMLSRMDLILSCKNSNITTEKLRTKGVVYNKYSDLLLLTMGNETDTLIFCEFKMKTIEKLFCNMWNYCKEETNQTIFSQDCQKDEKRYSYRCYKEETSINQCENFNLHQKYLVSSCQISLIANALFISMEDPKIIYGSTLPHLEKTNNYGMMISNEQIIFLRKREIPFFFDEPVMFYGGTDFTMIFDIDSDKFIAPWDSRKGVLYIDAKDKNAIYFKTTTCPNGNCTEYLFNSPVECTHSFCNDFGECLTGERHVFCDPLWFNIVSYASKRKLIFKDGTEEVKCKPLSNYTEEKCSYNLQEYHKKFLTAPLVYSPLKELNHDSFLSLKLVIISLLIISLLLILVGIFSFKILRKRMFNKDSSNILMNDLPNATDVPAIPETPLAPVVEYDNCIDQNGEVDKNKLAKEDEIIGRGNFGYVRKEFLCTNGKVKKVAVKYLKQPYNESDLFKEIKAIKLCKHNNIVRFVGFVQNDEGFGLVTEFMDGGDLHTYLVNQNNTIMVSQIFSYITQIVDAMAYLSHMHILHRDLATRNLLLNTAHTTIKITDFGLAREMDQFYQYYTEEDLKLPVKWFPLEVMDAIVRKKFTSKVDVWSFGVVIWEMFERGATPYGDMSFSELKQFLKSGERLRRPGLCPEELYTVMLQCWDVDPLKRPTFDILKERIAMIIHDIAKNEPATMNMKVEFRANIDYENRNVTTNVSQKAEYTDTPAVPKYFEFYELPKSGAAEEANHSDTNGVAVFSDLDIETPTVLDDIALQELPQSAAPRRTKHLDTTATIVLDEDEILSNDAAQVPLLSHDIID